MIDVLLRADPSRARTDREKQQADEVYRPGNSFRVRVQSFFLSTQGRGLPSRDNEQIPTPREASPDPTIPQSGEFARPCPHCVPGNRFGWQCPNPVPDPTSDPEHAWPMDEGSPPGHACCGNWSAPFPHILFPFSVNSLDLNLASQREFARNRCTHDDKVRHVSSILLWNWRAAPLPCRPPPKCPSAWHVRHQRPHPVHRGVRVLRRKRRRGRDHA